MLLRCVSVPQFSIGHVFDAIEQRSISRRKTPRCEPLEQHVGAKYVDQVLDCLYVLECSMRHFFMRAELGKHSGARKPHQVDEDYKQAAALAALAAPFRHARLSAVKLAGDPNNPVRFKDDASADELREEIMRRLGHLVSAGVIDLKACRCQMLD